MSSSKGFEWQGKDSGLDARFSTVWVTPEFGKLIDWHILKDRDFSSQLATDSLSVNINESSARFTGLKDPFGAVLKCDNKTYTIVGVVKDFIQNSPYHSVAPGLYLLDSNNAEWILLKLNPAQSVSASLAKVEAVFKRFTPPYHLTIHLSIRLSGKNLPVKSASASWRHFFPVSPFSFPAWGCLVWLPSWRSSAPKKLASEKYWEHLYTISGTRYYAPDG